MVMKARGVKCLKFGREAEPFDQVSVEEPLELLVDGHPVSVLMRTPGDDEGLMLGFLLTEGIVDSVEEIERVALDYGENRCIAFLREGTKLDLERLSRHMFTASSCGICGKASIDAALQVSPPLTGLTLTLSEETLLGALAKMEERQKTFQQTGGLHAAALFSLGGELLSLGEDVGRHNAVDKVLGECLRARVDFGQTFLVVSGRVSFEIVQKALAARVPCLAAVSAPSSLAVETAEAGHMTLVGFLRPPRWNLYVEGQVQLTANAKPAS